MKIASTISQNALFNGLLQRFKQLSSPLQFGLVGLIFTLTAAWLIFKLLLPLYASRASLQQQLPMLEREYVLMQSQALEIETLRKLPNIAPQSTQKRRVALSVEAVTAQFGSNAVVSKVSDSVVQLGLPTTTMSQFIDNIAALQAATGATVGNFSLKATNISGQISAAATLQATAAAAP